MAKINKVTIDSSAVTSPQSLGELLRTHSAGLDGVGLEVVLSPYEHSRLGVEAGAVGIGSVREYMLSKLNEALLSTGKEAIPLDGCAYISAKHNHTFKTMNKATS